MRKELSILGTWGHPYVPKVDYSEHVLQRELHDSGVSCKSEETKELIILRRARILRAEAVGHVISFRAKLHALRFFDTEAPRQRHIK